MACCVFENLQRRWKSLIIDPNRSSGARSSDHEEEPAVVAYYEMAEHRPRCEVCRHEDLSQGLRLQVCHPKLLRHTVVHDDR
jgi:hypothetical protein